MYTTYLRSMEWDVIHLPQWIGLLNYLKVFSTPDLLNALKDSAYWVFGTLVFAVGFPLLITALLNRMRGKAIFKAIFFIPSTMSPTVAAIFWRKVLASQQGALMPILEALGITVQPLLTNPEINTFIMIGI